MNIVFFCQSCGNRFEVSSASAGKKGRCKSCGQMMTIPKVQDLASMVAIPALSMAASEAMDGTAAMGTARNSKGGNSLSWLAAAPSSVALAPLTVDGPSIGGRKRPIKPTIDDDLGDGKPYALAEPSRPASKASPVVHAAGAVKMRWRKELGVVQRLFRWLNETAYLVSVPFLMLFLLGAIVRSRPLALSSATAVVLLNIGRIVAGLANVLVVPFRDGIVQGILFLIPPLTFFYMSSHWHKLKKPTMRIVGPILTIALVLVAFTFIPSLRQDGEEASIADLKGQLREGVGSLKGEMIGEVEKAKALDVRSLGNEAERKVREAAGQINSIGK